MFQLDHFSIFYSDGQKLDSRAIFRPWWKEKKIHPALFSVHMD